MFTGFTGECKRRRFQRGRGSSCAGVSGGQDGTGRGMHSSRFFLFVISDFGSELKHQGIYRRMMAPAMCGFGTAAVNAHVEEGVAYLKFAIFLCILGSHVP